MQIEKANSKRSGARGRGGVACELLGDKARGLALAELERAQEALPGDRRLAGALRALAPLSAELRGSIAAFVAHALEHGVSDASHSLVSAGLRALAEAGDPRVIPTLSTILLRDDLAASPLAYTALSAASLMSDPSLSSPLSRAASSRHVYVAFAAEVARVVRGESTGALLASVAPMIKESHRIALCAELFVPLTRRTVIAPGTAAALALLRSAERHLGRWLVLGEIAAKSGDLAALREASASAEGGTSSSRAAWAFVGWALADTSAKTQGRPAVEPPLARPTVELIARLSDRPSADRDMTFLFRIASARAPAVRPMLESLLKSDALPDDVAVRAAFVLARDYGRADLRDAIARVARDPERAGVRGLATAAIAELGNIDLATIVADELLETTNLADVTWAARIHAARDSVLSEFPFRAIQRGWIE